MASRKHQKQDATRPTKARKRRIELHSPEPEVVEEVSTRTVEPTPANV
jgi:hypothetical protein